MAISVTAWTMPSCAALAYACVDVGSNTTRLLVAELRGGELRELTSQRAFTRLGKCVLEEGRLTADKIAETAAIVAAQAQIARDLGVLAIDVVGTAVVRDAPNRGELEAAVERAAGVPMRVVSPEEEARLAFHGVLGTLTGASDGRLVVVDVGGWSTEVVQGTRAAGVSWSESFRLGSGLLADVYFHSDPPDTRELAAVTAHISEVLAPLDLPKPDRAVAVGGSATSVRRMVGREVTRRALERSLQLLARSSCNEVAARIDLHPERVRLMPAGISILHELSRRLDIELELGNGGLREGVVLELAARTGGLRR
jgi:exopolyphosphatase / guanosine-5'-triphosphate,3'-diphosphate pyrophosphatase